MRFQHQPIQEPFLEFAHPPVLDGAPIQFVYLLANVEKSGDEAIQMPGDVDEQLRILFPLAAGIRATTLFIAFGEGRGRRPKLGLKHLAEGNQSPNAIEVGVAKALDSKGEIPGRRGAP